MCWSPEINAFGPPYRIPPRELLKFGVDLADAARVLHFRGRTAPPTAASA